MTIKLFWFPKTRSSRIAWLLNELGLEYERVTIDIREPNRVDPPDFQRASPMGKVPAILDGDVAMSDSASIGIYLADRYSLGSLAPNLDAPDRGQYIYWMTFAPGVIEPALVEKASKMEPNKPRNSWGSWDCMLDVLAKGTSSGPWLLGDKFSAADVLVGSSVVFMRMMGVLPENEALSAYADRCLARPAYQKAMAEDG